MTTVLVTMALVVGAVVVAVGWAHGCGFSYAENTDPAPGHACGLVRSHLQWTLLLLPALPGAALRRGLVAYGLASLAAGGLLILVNLIVAPG